MALRSKLLDKKVVKSEKEMLKTVSCKKTKCCNQSTVCSKCISRTALTEWILKVEKAICTAVEKVY